jgi:hypothetical protein
MLSRRCQPETSAQARFCMKCLAGRTDVTGPLPSTGYDPAAMGALAIGIGCTNWPWFPYYVDQPIQWPNCS